MKRFTTCLCSLIICCLLCNVALAESIVLPKGLRFGMSISEAIAISGCQKSKLGISEKDYYNACNISFLEDCITTSVVIGGIDAEMLVLFDANGLRQIRYRFIREEVGKEQSSMPGKQVSASHQKVDASLEQKYGKSLDSSKYRHMYMPLVDQYIYWTQRVEFGGRVISSFSHMTTALMPTLRIVKMEDGSSVYLDNYIRANDNGVQFHELTYTYYDFSIDDGTQSTSIDF